MARRRKRTPRSPMRAGKPKVRAPWLSKARLDQLVEQATVDCYDESEQVSGLFTMIEEHLKFPFKTAILGVEVTVERVEQTEWDDIVAICRRGRESQSVPLLELRLPSPPPPGAEWIEAYRHWARGGRSPEL